MRSPDPEREAVPVADGAGKRRCRMHDGAPGSGAPLGNRMRCGMGTYTAKAIAARRGIRALLRESRSSPNRIYLRYFECSAHTPTQPGSGGCSRKLSMRARKTSLGGLFGKSRDNGGSRQRHRPKLGGDSCQCRLEHVAQFEPFRADFAGASEQFEDPLGLALANDEHSVNLARLDRRTGEAPRLF